MAARKAPKAKAHKADEAVPATNGTTGINGANSVDDVNGAIDGNGANGVFATPAASLAPAAPAAVARGPHTPHGNGDARLKLRRPDLYINREVANVRFIRRVFEEAQSERHPLLERVKFLSFVGSQLDEFLMVRYAGLYDQYTAQVNEAGHDGLPPWQQLKLLRPMILQLMREERLYLRNELLPPLAQAGIEILD